MKKTAGIVLLLLSMLTGIGGWLFSHRNRPQFCWLVFGPDARVRILACLDGTAVSLEKHDGPTMQQLGSWDHLEDCKQVAIPADNSGTSYVLSGITDLGVVPPDKLVEFAVEIRTPAGEYRQAGCLWLNPEPAQAAVVAFHGPLSAAFVDKKIDEGAVRWDMPAGLVFRRGDKTTDLFVNVGTTNDQNSCRVVVSTLDPQTNQPLFPKDVHPVADIEFPGKDPNGPPIHKRYPLAVIC